MIESGWILITCSGISGRALGRDSIDPFYLTAFLMSECGYEQIISKKYGEAADELSDADIKEMGNTIELLARSLVIAISPAKLQKTNFELINTPTNRCEDLF